VKHRTDLGFFRNVGDVIPGWDADRIFSEIGDDIEVWNVVGSTFSQGVDEMAARQSSHPEEQWWFYISCCAGEPAVGSPYIEGEALSLRTWGWINYRYRLQGAVTWEMDAGYTNLPACWTDPKCAGWDINGDAYLFYAGWTVGLPAYQPVPSIRLKNLRRGSQDYEYLWLLEQQDGSRGRADSLAAGVVQQALNDGLDPYTDTPPGRWAHTPASYEAARRQAADWLSGGGCTLTCTASAGTPSGLTVPFTASATATGCSGTPAFSWSFGDSQGSSQQNPSHTYAAAGTYTWTLTASVDGETCTKTGSVTVTSVAPPVVSALTKKGNPFRIVVTGSNLQAGVQVYIGGSSWANFSWKSVSKLVLTGGGSLKAAVPRGTPTQFRFINPDGGEATLTWSW
jgi:hypothetical protein